MKDNITLKIKHAKAKSYQSKEAYKTIRTNLEFCGDNVRVIALTSCLPNEGKSSASLNLAISFAEMQSKVLFVDADLRKSIMAGRYKIPKKIMGFTHCLTGKCTLSEAIHPTDVENLDIIYAGIFPPEPTQLLAGKRFKELLSEAKEKYDYIIFDTPPLGSVIDCAIIAPLMDGVVLLVAANSISYRLAQDVKAQLDKTGCHVLGAILNKVDMSKNSYYSKYYHNKRYGRYYRRYYNRYYKNSSYGRQYGTRTPLPYMSGPLTGTASPIKKEDK